MPDKDANEDFEILVGDGGLFDDELLTNAYAQTSEGKVAEALQELVRGLDERRQESSDREWKEFVRLSSIHPMKHLLHEDPFTHLAFAKVSGYSGDAQCLDLLLQDRSPDGATPLGADIYRFTTQMPYAQSLRSRACRVAEVIDRLALQNPAAALLTVAAGHLREADFTGALRRRQFGRWVALEADRGNLAEIESSYGRFGVQCEEMTIRRFLSGKVELGQFHLVYSGWLFDYLDRSLGQRLVKQLFELLLPGGVLLLTAVNPAMPGRGFMECFMDWHLVYRTPAELLELTDLLDRTAVRDLRLSSDPSGNVVMLEITKRV